MGLKVADSYFIDPDTGKEIEVLMRYTNSGDSIMQTPHNYFRMKNGIVEKQRDEDLWEEPNTEDPNYWLNNFKQAILNLQLPKRVVRYIWDKIFKQGHGGTMNYTQYLQDGGELELPQVERGLGEQEVKALVLAIIENGDEQAADTLIELLKLDPENGWITDWIVGAKEAAEAGDENAQKFWSLIGPRLEALQQTEQFKCGGKVRAKVKKACGGKKLEKGAKIPVEKKGGCPCQYRRVGGRIQLVDCNGIPVAKNGDVLKMQRGNQLPPTQASDAVRNYMTAKQYSIGEVMDAIGNTIPAYRLWNKHYPSFVNRMNQWQDSIFGTPTTVKKVTTVETTQPSVGSEAWKAQQRANQEKYYETPEGRAAIEKANSASIQQPPAAALTRVYARTPDQVKAWNNARLNSDTIKYIQRALNIMGYNSGEPTGVMDLKTIDAIRAFQESNGLKVDGLFGAKTRAAFEEKVAEGQYSQSNFGQPKVNNDGVLEVGRKPLTMDEWELAELKKKQPLVAALTSNAQPITVAPISTDRVLAKLPTKIVISKQGAKMGYADYLK